MLFKTVTSFALVALALASPAHVKRNAPDCPGNQYCRGAILDPAEGSTIDKTFSFKYETNPKVKTLSVTPELSYTGKAPTTHQWDPIIVTGDSGTIEAQLTIPDDFAQSGTELYLYGLDNQTVGDDGKTVAYYSAHVTVNIK